MQHATEEPRGARVFFRRVLLKDGLSLQFATEELKGDYDIVKMAVHMAKLFSLPLFFLRENRSICKIACRFFPGAVDAPCATILSYSGSWRRRRSGTIARFLIHNFENKHNI